MYEGHTNGANVAEEEIASLLLAQFPGIDKDYLRKVARNPLAQKPEFHQNLATILLADEDSEPDAAIWIALRWTDSLPTDPQEISRRAHNGRRYEEQMRLLTFDLSTGRITREQYQEMGQEISNKYHADQS